MVPPFALLMTPTNTPISEEIMSIKKFAIAATLVAGSVITGASGAILAIGNWYV